MPSVLIRFKVLITLARGLNKCPPVLTKEFPTTSRALSLIMVLLFSIVI